MSRVSMVCAVAPYGAKHVEMVEHMEQVAY